MAVQSCEGHFTVDRGKGDKMIVVRFADRMKIQDAFEAWCVKNQTTPSMQTMIAFLEHKGWLNVDRVVKDLKD